MKTNQLSLIFIFLLLLCSFNLIGSNSIITKAEWSNADSKRWTINDAGKAEDCVNAANFNLRINTGGMSTSYNDETFVADNYFDTGNTLDRPQTGLAEPYQTFRFSRSQVMGYNIPVPDGEYTVNLHFAELWFGATAGGAGGVGSRVFDVNIEGALAEDNLDVFAEVGADAMLMKTYTVTVTDGILNLDFDSRDEVGGVRHPIINAIEILGNVSEPIERPFITTWKTDNQGNSADNQITIPTSPEETYNYSVDWGDGSSDTGITGNITHTYDQSGTYQVSISGNFSAMKFGSYDIVDRHKISEINQWGDIEWSSFDSAFLACTNMTISATDIPDLRNVTSLAKAFYRCSSLTNNGHFENWDVSNIENMNQLFVETPFNQDISRWNVSKVKDMYGMFRKTPFNQNIGSWDTSSSESMRQMFYFTPFNQNIGGWDVSKVRNMEQMFSYSSFNQDISSWDVSSVTDIASIFSNSPFNQDIGNWNVGSVERMGYMFDKARNFNQNIGSWNVGNVKYAQGMFRDAVSFNQDISSWNTVNLIIMQRMFRRATAFDQNIGAWNVENVTNMEGMFTEVVLSNENYDSILYNWSNQNVQSSVEFDAGFSQYCESKEARQKLSNVFGWVITDGGESIDCEVTIPDSEFALRLNTGGELVEFNGNTFLADNNFDRGVILNRPQTGLPEPYQSFRFSRSQMMGYDIPVPNGEYAVKLHFAELWFGATSGGSGGVGSRVFDVSLEGQLAEDNLDIFAEVGADAMLVKTYTVTVTDGILEIDFDARDVVGGTRHPIINAIEILGNVSEPVERPFITTWKTDNQGNSADNQITIPTFPGEVYNYTVDWGDGSTDTGVTGNITHTYDLVGTYTVSISGDFPRIYCNNSGDANKLTSINQWGSMVWSSMEKAFSGTGLSVLIASDIPDFSIITSMSSMFRNSFKFKGNSSMNNWDLGSVTDMSNMFNSCVSFNTLINSWDVSNVTNMEFMFFNAEDFNQDLDSWNVSKVHDMTAMFFQALNFNGAIANWNVSNVNRMGRMFRSSNFNSNISNWNVSNVQNMDLMFRSAFSFDQDLGGWVVGQVQHMEEIFNNSGLSNENYDNILIGWSQLPLLQNGVQLDALENQYCDAEQARQHIIDTYGWTINDDGKAIDCGVSVERPFITTWKTDNEGDSADNQITIPTSPEETYNYTVNWGDGSSDTGVTGDITHTYNQSGTYQVSISGNFAAMKFGSYGLGDRHKITEIIQWGDIEWSSFDTAFLGCANMIISAIDIPDLGNVTSLDKAFFRCYSLTNNRHFENWDVSNIENMNQLFVETPFNQDISRWNVSKVKRMYSMFNDTPFNQNIGSWDTSSSENMRQMFYDTPFNQNIGNWDVSKVENTEQMFSYSSFNQDIRNWNVSSVTSMGSMFSNSPFNQDISNWNVSSVTNMSLMFSNTPFNQDISNWNMENVEGIGGMFSKARNFNQNIGSWNIGNVKYAQGMFQDAISFNQDLSSWNTVNLIATRRMFKGATAFDQDIGAWNIENVTNMEGMFTDIVLSNENYNSILYNWSKQNVQSSVEFDAGFSQYCESKEARQKLSNDFGWVITDGGESIDCEVTIPDSEFALRLNTGGELVEFNGNTFLADNNFDRGVILNRPQTGLPEPYQSFRYSRSQVMGYDIPIPNGEYTVKLHFAELWFGATGGGSGGVGSRVFDVSIEEQLIEDNLDIFAEVGADAMLVKTYTVTVTDGILEIDFDARDVVGGTRHPVINAIEVLEISIANNSNSGKLVIRKEQNSNKMMLYPNQVSDVAKVSFVEPVELQQILVFDMIGRLIRSYNPNEVKIGEEYAIDVNTYQQGTYIVKMINYEGVSFEKRMMVKRK